MDLAREAHQHLAPQVMAVLVAEREGLGQKEQELLDKALTAGRTLALLMAVLVVAAGLPQVVPHQAEARELRVEQVLPILFPGHP